MTARFSRAAQQSVEFARKARGHRPRLQLTEYRLNWNSSTSGVPKFDRRGHRHLVGLHEELFGQADFPSTYSAGFPMSNSHVRSAKAIAGAVAYFCQVLATGDGGLLMLGRLVSQVC